MTNNETTKRILSMSSHLTPITNQANVANRIADAFGIEAGRRVWQASTDDWERVASEYVTLTEGNHYGTHWVEAKPPAHTNIANSMARHPAGKARPVPARNHLSLVDFQSGKKEASPRKTGAMAKLLRFLGAS